MNYELSVIVSLALFLGLDVIILMNVKRNRMNTETQRRFIRLARAVVCQQAFNVLSKLAEPAILDLGTPVLYISYSGIFIFMAVTAMYWNRYLEFNIKGDNEHGIMNRLLCITPVAVITVMCIASPAAHWIFSIDEAGRYCRGSMYWMQIVCTYNYIIGALIWFPYRYRNMERARVRKLLRNFAVFAVPSAIGAAVQFTIVRGGYSSIGLSIGLVMIYLELYVEEMNENRRLKSIEELNTDLTLLQIAIHNVYLRVCKVNLTRNTYRNFVMDDYMFKALEGDNDFSKAIDITAQQIPDDGQREKYLQLFSRDNQIAAYRAGRRTISLVHQQTGEDGKIHWMETQVIFVSDSSDIIQVALARCVDDEIEKQESLQNALERAEYANEAKTVFLNNMSHDIRTPMNAILGYASLAMNRKDEPAAVQDHLGKIHQAGEYLLSLINNVLDMARIESGKVELNEEAMDMYGCRSIIDLFRGEAGNKHISLTCDMDIEHRYVLADRARLTQISVNILGNALKYTPEGGSVHADIRELPCGREGYATYCMAVSDTGIGMSAEFISHIFELFSRERTSTESRVTGTGLGMSIVKRLTDLMGGTIDIKSEEGKGSTFTVTLTLQLTSASEIKPEKTQAEHTPADLGGRRVLIAEDNDLNAEIAMEMCAGINVQADRASDGAECVKMLTEAEDGRYDMILMDVQMPNMNGYEAAKRIRALDDPGKAAIPIYAITANAFDEDRRQALAAGMNGHISKPVDARTLQRVMEEQLAK